MKPFIGLKAVYYGDVLAAKLTKESFKTWLTTAKKIENVHEGTWKYEQEDATETEYINELTGEPYFVDQEKKGKKTMSITIGEYDVTTRVDLAGGKALDAGLGWEAPEGIPVIEKCFVGLTKTGNYIVFPKASIKAKADTQNKNVGLGITATAMATGVAGLQTEYLIDSSKVG